jgi:hypothetical protein
VTSGKKLASASSPKTGDYSKKTRIDVNEPLQVAYWSERFGVTSQELIAAILAVGPLAMTVEKYLTGEKDNER